MTATIRTKKNHPNYYICVRYKDEGTSKNKEKWHSTGLSVKGNNKRKVEAEKERILAEYKKNEKNLGDNTMFTDFMKSWLENNKKSFRTTTYDTYHLIIHNQIIPYFEPKHLKITEVKPAHIQEYINFKMERVSANTATKHLINISQCLDDAVRQDIIAVNPAKRVLRPKKVKYKAPKSYNEAEIARLLNISEGDILEPIILLGIFYGLRKSEILGLRWEAIDFVSRTISIKRTVVRVSKIVDEEETKTKSSYRTMPLSNIVTEALQKQLEKKEEAMKLQPNDYKDSGHVFTDINGKLISPNYISKHFQLLLKNNNMPYIRFHDLRHSTAAYLLSLGVNMKQIQEWLGHGDIGTTMNIYVSLDARTKREVADMLDDKFENLNKSK